MGGFVILVLEVIMPWYVKSLYLKEKARLPKHLSVCSLVTKSFERGSLGKHLMA